MMHIHFSRRKAAPLLFLALCWLFVVGTYALYGAHNIDSDVASEMVLADHLNREGALLSESWFYSTELRAVSPVPLYQWALRLFPGNWHAARTLSLALLLAGVAALLIYMARGAGMREGAVYAAGALLLPVSEVHRFLFSHGGFYTVYVILAAWIVGLVLRMGRGLRGHDLLLLAVLGLWGGLAGVRMPMIVGVPLFAACLPDACGAVRRVGSLRDALGHPQGSRLLAAGVMLAAMFAGYLINVLVYVQRYTFETHLNVTPGLPSPTLLLQQLGYIAGFFGFRRGASLLSASGMAQAAMLLLVLLMGATVCLLFAQRRTLCTQARVLLYYALCALGLGILVNVVMGKTGNPYAVGYYIMGVFSLVVLLFMAAEQMYCPKAWLTRAAMALLAGVFLVQGVMFSRNHIRREPSAHEEAAAWLTENGYTTGYATFWNGNVLTEASNGEIDMYVYSGWQDTELYDWLQETRHLEATPEGPVFVFVSGEEYYGKTVPAAREEHLVFTSETYGSRIYAYDDAAEVDALQRAQSMKNP